MRRRKLVILKAKKAQLTQEQAQINPVLDFGSHEDTEANLALDDFSLDWPVTSIYGLLSMSLSASTR